MRPRATNLIEPAWEHPQSDVEGGLEAGKGVFGRHRGVEQPDDEGQHQEHDETADAMQDRDDPRRRQPVRRQIFQGVDVAEFRPLFCKFCHVGSFWDAPAA